MASRTILLRKGSEKSGRGRRITLRACSPKHRKICCSSCSVRGGEAQSYSFKLSKEAWYLQLSIHGSLFSVSCSGCLLALVVFLLQRVSTVISRLWAAFPRQTRSALHIFVFPCRFSVVQFVGFVATTAITTATIIFDVAKTAETTLRAWKNCG